MHELGICDALLKMVDGIARDEGLACVRKVTVEVGSLSGVVPVSVEKSTETSSPPSSPSYTSCSSSIK